MTKAVLALVAGVPLVVVLGLIGWSYANSPSPSDYIPSGYAATSHAASAHAPAAPAQAPVAVPRGATQGSAQGSAGRTVPSVSEQWVTTTAAKAGIPATALRAYARAQLEAPCTIGWTTLAGLGWVESQHGTIGGRTVRADGHSSAPILGPALDGSGGLATVPADGGEWDHAVGPLQFIASTWHRWASDGDGDGVKDPNDIDDAAYAAARYLCASGQDLATGPGWAAAVYSYNHSQDYVNHVYAAASAYDERTR